MIITTSVKTIELLPTNNDFKRVAIFIPFILILIYKPS